MKWLKVKSPRIQPTKGDYSDWKQQIADDCWQQCVYCAIHESRYGGLDNFHVEHHRPKSRFRRMINLIKNLFLACPVCNRFKSNDWPNDPLPDHSLDSYPDPSECDYNDLFRLNANFEVEGLNVAARYVTERLYLNRPQLILERRTAVLAQRTSGYENFVERVAPQLQSFPQDAEAVAFLCQLATSMADLSRTFRNSNSVRPYRLEDVRRRAD